jgi:hypothetical protein
MKLPIKSSLLVKGFRADRVGQIGSIVGVNIGYEYDIDENYKDRTYAVYRFDILWPDGTLQSHQDHEFVVLDHDENPDAVWDWLQEELKISREKF